MRRFVAYIAALIVALIAPAMRVSSQDAPRVESTIPEDGAVDADPHLREIVIRFDRDMNTHGQSICGGGPAFPKLGKSGRAAMTWRDKRTFVLSVRLEPDHDYELSVNCPSAQNFKSAQGDPAAPTPLKFRTAASSGKPKSPDEPTADSKAGSHRDAAKTLREALRLKYSHAKLHPVDWDRAWKDYGPQLEGAATAETFAETAAKLLALADDLHITVSVGERTLATSKRQTAPNVRPKLLAKQIPRFEELSPILAAGRFNDGIGYLYIKSLPSDLKQLQPALERLSEWREERGVILDIRGNAGGSELAARVLAGYFVTAPMPYAQSLVRDGPQGEFSGPHQRVVRPGKVRCPQLRVAVLMGPANTSSAESFLMMMQQVERALLIGAKSYGSSGNPKPVDLRNGVTVHLPSWIDQDLQGQPIEGRGIEPDVAVDWPATGVGDPVLDAALQWLRSEPKN